PAGAAVVVALFDDVRAVAGAPALASGPHSDLRKSFHFIPLAAPAAWAALYLALHSCIVSACAGNAKITAAVTAAAQKTAELVIIGVPPPDFPPPRGAGHRWTWGSWPPQDIHTKLLSLLPVLGLDTTSYHVVK